MAAVTPRGKATRWLHVHRGLTEQPADSNRDERPDGISAAQRRLGPWLVGAPWCGVWFANALLAGGAKGVTYRLASVSLIEDDARAGRPPFQGWIQSSAYKRVQRGDGVVLFGRGIHVETVRAIRVVKGVGLCVITDGGNTSPTPGSGSESNGGGAYRRVRPIDQVYGFAAVRFPGTWQGYSLPHPSDLKVEPSEMLAVKYEPLQVESSDRLLARSLPPDTPSNVARLLKGLV